MQTKHYFIPTVVRPVVNVDSTTSTSIQISWTGSCPEVDEYKIALERDTTKKCRDIELYEATIINHSNSLNIKGLEEGSRYIITMAAKKIVGVISNSVIGITSEAGKGLIACMLVKL